MEILIIIRGPLGVGKSTVAKELAAKLSGEHISIDRVLEELELDKSEEEGIPLRNFLAANHHVLPFVKKNIGRSPVIIDGNFYHAEQIHDLVKQVSTSHIFTLMAPLEVCIERDKARGRSYGEDATRAVFSLVSRVKIGTVIDITQKTPLEVVAEIEAVM